MQETVPEMSSLCEVKLQLDVCNFCDIMQRSNFIGGNNNCQVRVKLSGTSQVKFSVRMISQLGVQEMLKATVFQYLPQRDPVVLTDEPDNLTPTLTWKALPIE